MNPFEPIWAKYYAPHLTKTEVNQLRRAKSGSQSLLLTDVIQKQGFDPRQRTYMPVACNKNVPGRSHYAVANLIEGRDAGWDQQCLFANALRVAAQGDDDFGSPSTRVVVAPHHILTIEFDEAEVGFFQQQLGWLRSSRNALDSFVGQFVAHLRNRYADVVGLSVVYSGHKSLHFHFVVSTSVVTGAVSDPTSARFGFQSGWDRLHAEFLNFAPFDIPVGMKADASLRQPETFRRLPGGMRLNDQPNHLFEVPLDEPLFQGVLWEHLKLDRGGGGMEALLDPADFTRPSVSRPQRKSAPTPVQGSADQTDEDAHASQKLAAFFDGVTRQPKFAHLDRSSGAPVAYFYNHALDQRPTSVMRSDFATVLVQGGNPQGLTNDASNDGALMSRLPHPLGIMLDIWGYEFRREHVGPGGRVRSPAEAAFAEQAVDQASATKAMADVLIGSLTENVRRPETLMLCAPEGISKTRSLMTAAPDLISALCREGLPSWLMFASPTYEGAKEKAEEFSAMHADDMRGMTPVVVPSFDRMYRELCGKSGYLSHERAARDGYESRWDMIRAEQSDVARRIDSTYADLRATLAAGSPVIFTVHDVAQAWAKDTHSRLLLSAGTIETPADRLVAREATRLGLLVHDEISANAIVEVVASENVEGIRELVGAMGWTSRTPLRERWKTFQASGCKAFTFDEVCRIAAVPESEWEQVETPANYEYGRCVKGHEDIYAAAADHRRWHIRRRNWAREAAHKTTVLTTEFVPLILAEHIGDWQTTSLDAPRLDRDAVSARPDRSLTTRTAARHVLAARADHPTRLLAIGNKLRHLSDAETHASAKGSNAYIGEDVVQTLTMMPPEQYAHAQALNAWTGRTDLARISHIDQFNQTAGRNLGFRKRGAATHQVFINRRLFDSLAPVMSYARYDILDDCAEVSMKLHRRRAAKAKAAKRGRSPEMCRLIMSVRSERNRRLREQRRFG